MIWIIIYRAYIVNDDVFGVTDKEMLELDSNGHLIMTRSSQSGGMQFMDVSEQGLINAFHDFFENLETDSRVTMGDSAKMYIQDIINEYNSKLSSGGGVQPRKGTGRMAGRTTPTTAGSRK